MKNRTRIIGVIFFALIIAFSITACDNQTPGEKARADLTGTWKYEEAGGYTETIKFSGNTFEWKESNSSDILKGTFTAENNIITVKFTEPDYMKDEVGAMRYKLEGNNLTLYENTNDPGTVYKKQ
jgi:hypothetical protein